jgi:hypothetical protein
VGPNNSVTVGPIYLDTTTETTSRSSDSAQACSTRSAP